MLLQYLTERFNIHRKFKIKAVNENLAGKGPTQIFIENGFDLEMIGLKKLNQL